MVATVPAAPRVPDSDEFAVIMGAVTIGTAGTIGTFGTVQLLQPFSILNCHLLLDRVGDAGQLAFLVIVFLGKFRFGPFGEGG